jgi:NADH:ubiquinone oxidoreductase subunit F (NADH-binding)
MSCLYNANGLVRERFAQEHFTTESICVGVNDSTDRGVGGDGFRTGWL